MEGSGQGISTVRVAVAERLVHLRRAVGVPRWITAVSVCFAAGSAAPAPAQTVPDGLGDTWLAAVERLLQEDATTEDLERLTFFYDVDVVYEHPRVGARIRGRDALTEAMAEYLGQTRRPDVDLHGSTTGEGVIVLDYTLEMEMRTDIGWRPLERRQVTVLEVTPQGRIRRVLEYW